VFIRENSLSKLVEKYFNSLTADDPGFEKEKTFRR